MAPDDRADLQRNPTAGLVAIMSAKSCSAWVEISITGALRPSRWSCSASSKPLSAPRLMSTSITSGRSSSARRSASALVVATPTTRDPLEREQPTRGLQERRVVIDD